MRRFIYAQSRAALAVNVALVIFAQGKGGATPAQAPVTTRIRQTIQSADPQDIKSLETQIGAVTSPQQVQRLLARTAVETSSTFTRPMNEEELRLWLQSYNAGPYAVLRYKGSVPYRETRNYAPRVLEYYKKDLSHTPYDPYIVAAAVKYGLDPQMVRAIMATESYFDNKEVSSAGARGLMQVMPVVWSEIKSRYGLNWKYKADVFDPQKNIEVACAYLAWLRYDFLPKHFAAFDANPLPPPALIRDNRLHPSTIRIIADAALPPAPGKTTVAKRDKAAVVADSALAIKPKRKRESAVAQKSRRSRSRAHASDS